MKRILALVFILVGLSGCVEDKPRPEGRVEIVPLQVMVDSSEVVEVLSQKQHTSFYIKHHVRNQDVYVECYIPHFSFKEKGGKKVMGEGHLRVYVDGNSVGEINTAAFMVKGLDKGVHELLVKVVHNDSTSYGLKKSWDVTIQ